MLGKQKTSGSRVCSHFSNNSPGLRKQEFLTEYLFSFLAGLRNRTDGFPSMNA